MTDKQKQKMAEEYANRLRCPPVMDASAVRDTAEHCYLEGLNARDEEVNRMKELMNAALGAQTLTDVDGHVWLNSRDVKAALSEALEHTSKKEGAE